MRRHYQVGTWERGIFNLWMSFYFFFTFLLYFGCLFTFLLFTFMDVFLLFLLFYLLGITTPLLLVQVLCHFHLHLGVEILSYRVCNSTLYHQFDNHHMQLLGFYSLGNVGSFHYPSICRTSV